MKRIYQAANNIEAHMLVHLLEQEGIEAHVEGEHLQSGAGELSHASRESSTAARSPTSAELDLDADGHVERRYRFDR